MTTYLGKSCSFGFPRVPFVNCRQFMYLVISLLILRAGCGIWLYQFLIIAYLFTFQVDLDALEDLESKWQMNFQKCQVIRTCTNKRFQRETTYTLHGHILEAVDSAKYLGVTISEDLQWKTEIDNITAKASRTVEFLRRNLYNCTK